VGASYLLSLPRLKEKRSAGVHGWPDSNLSILGTRPHRAPVAELPPNATRRSGIAQERETPQRQ